MRQLPWTERFDRLVNWGVSFGYFDDETNRRVLAGFRRALRPGGRLLLEHANLTSVARGLPPQGAPRVIIYSERGDDLYILRRRYNLLTGCIDVEQLIVRSGQLRRHPYSIRNFTFVELRDWLLQAGFSRAEPFGGDGGPLTLDSGNMIVVAYA